MRHAILCGLLFGASLVRADVRVDYAVEGDCAVEPASISVSGSRLRIDSALGGQAGSAVYDGLEETVVWLDHGRRHFRTIEVDADASEYTADVATSSLKFAENELAKAQREIDANCEQMQKRGMACPQMPAMDMQSLMQMAQGMAAQGAVAGAGAAGATQPGAGQLASGADAEAMQRLMEQMSAGAPETTRPAPPPASPQFVDTGEDATIESSICRWHELRIGDMVQQKRCVAAVEALPLDARDRSGMQRAMDTLTRYGRAFDPWLKLVGGSAASTPPAGLVLAQQCFDARGELQGRADASFTHDAVDDGAFEVPSDYSPLPMQ